MCNWLSCIFAIVNESYMLRKNQFQSSSMEYRQLARVFFWIFLCCLSYGEAVQNYTEILEQAFNNVRGFRISQVCSTNCQSLQALRLPSKNLAGIVDWRRLSKFEDLQAIDLSDNSLSGHITDDLWSMPSLKSVNLARNELGGSLNFNWSKYIPPKTSHLESLNLSYNRIHMFDSTLDLSGFKILQTVDLSHNKIVGNKVISELLKLVSVHAINLSRNNLFSLPKNTRNVKYSQLKYLDLSSCNLSGSIMPIFSSPPSSLQHLDVSNNNLKGYFPSSLPSQMHFLNISFNNFSGELSHGMVKSFAPSAFIQSGLKPIQNKSNPNPSQEIKHKPPQKIKSNTPSLTTGAIAGIAASAFILIFAVLACFLVCLKRPRSERKWLVSKPPFLPRTSSESGPFSFETDSCTWVADIKTSSAAPVVIFEKPLLSLTFTDLLSFTSHFSKESQLAEGQNGPVYRAILPGDIHVAIKVLEGAKDLSMEEAVPKLESLGRLKHHNIVPLLGYCIAGKEKLLIYEFMQNGDLHQWLHELPGLQPPEDENRRSFVESWEENGSTHHQNQSHDSIASDRMTWDTRHRIALGVARALAFLHHGSSVPVVHGCLTPYNILLDENFEPHVAESGIRDIVKSSSTNPCYTAPEFMQLQSSDELAKADVYSFGVVLLELVTGKMVNGGFSDGYNGDLVGWVRQLVRQRNAGSAVDERLVSEDDDEGRRMVDALQIGYLCTAESPGKRPSMHQVVGLLKDIQPDNNNNG